MGKRWGSNSRFYRDKPCSILRNWIFPAVNAATKVLADSMGWKTRTGVIGNTEVLSLPDEPGVAGN